VSSFRIISFVGALVASFACTSRERDVARADGAAGAAAAGAPLVVDAFGDSVRTTTPATRIASLNPATTELVFALGAGDRLVGRTHWDSYPPEALAVPDLGDGMRPNVERIVAARPDLVLLYASAENRAARDALHRAGIATFTQRIDRIGDFAKAIVDLARAIGDTTLAAAVRDSVLASVASAHSRVQGLPAPKVLWPLWEAPLMAVGKGSFLNDLLEAAGARNIFADLDAPSPNVTFEEAVRRDPDIVLIGASGAGTIRTDPRWRALRAVREGHVVAYDTLIVSRPGVRLGEAANHLAELLHPGLRGK